MIFRVTYRLRGEDSDRVRVYESALDVEAAVNHFFKDLKLKITNIVSMSLSTTNEG